jgi:hypothetical protein
VCDEFLSLERVGIDARGVGCSFIRALKVRGVGKSELKGRYTARRWERGL